MSQIPTPSPFKNPSPKGLPGSFITTPPCKGAKRPRKIFRRPLTPTLYHARPLPVNVGLAHNVQSLRRTACHPPPPRLSITTPAPVTHHTTTPAPAQDRPTGSQRPGNGVNAQMHITALPTRQNAATHSYSSCHGKKKGHPTVKQDAPDRAMKKSRKRHHHEAQTAKIPRSIRHCTTGIAQSQAREISVTGGVLPGPWLSDRRLRFRNGGGACRGGYHYKHPPWRLPRLHRRRRGGAAPGAAWLPGSIAPAGAACPCPLT